MVVARSFTKNSRPHTCTVCLSTAPVHQMCSADGGSFQQIVLKMGLQVSFQFMKHAELHGVSINGGQNGYEWMIWGHPSGMDDLGVPLRKPPGMQHFLLSEVGHGDFFIRLDLLSGAQDEVVLSLRA